MASIGDQVPNPPLHVWIFTPLGEGGQGGIDRLMDEIRLEIRKHPIASCEVRFVITRGKGQIFLSPFYLSYAIAKTAVARIHGQIGIAHLNLSVCGSTYRKAILAQVLSLLRVPYVLHVHGSGYEHFWAGARPWIKKNISRLCFNSTAIIVLGDSVRASFVKIEPEVSDKIIVLPNATRATERANPVQTKKTLEILFLGQLGRRKGIPQLVEALSQIRDRTDWHATLAGDGEVEKTRALIAQLGLTDRILIPGWLGDNEVRDLLHTSSILVLPSFEEALPMAIVEALCHGLAIVATPVGAIPDVVIDNETGLLIPAGDSRALSEALIKLLEDRQLRARLGMAARALFDDKLEIRTYVRRLAEIWQQSSASLSRSNGRRGKTWRQALRQ